MTAQYVITSTPTISALPPLSAPDAVLYSTFRSEAQYIWTDEGSPPRPGDSPAGEQRAFRTTFTYPPERGAPSNVTLIVAADDYYAMFVNGILVHPPDKDHNYQNVFAFNIPLPLVEGESPSANLTLAFRVVQIPRSFAGLIVAAQVHYPNAPSDVFHTGMSQPSWLGERNFQEHWEQPWFDPAPQRFTVPWAPAITHLPELQADNRHTMPNNQVMTFERLPALSFSPSTPLGAGKGLSLSVGGLAGVLIGCIALSLSLGALGAYFLLRRVLDRERERVEPYGGVAFSQIVPETHPGRPIYIQ